MAVPYTFEPMPRLYLNWKDQPELFERYWDQAMAKIEELQKLVNDLNTSVFP